eukprot:scaffold38795_cov47-Phaeocystis_antarctica.AAC.2
MRAQHEGWATILGLGERYPNDHRRGRVVSGLAAGGVRRRRLRGRRVEARGGDVAHFHLHFNHLARSWPPLCTMPRTLHLHRCGARRGRLLAQAKRDPRLGAGRCRRVTGTARACAAALAPACATAQATTATAFAVAWQERHERLCPPNALAGLCLCPPNAVSAGIAVPADQSSRPAIPLWESRGRRGLPKRPALKTYGAGDLGVMPIPWG